MITHDDFKKLDIKIAVIKEAVVHPDADKLYVLKVDLGGEEKQLVAGIRKYYLPEELLGKQVVVLNNLEPRTVRGVESQGMLLVASDDEGLSMLTTDKPRKLGSIIS
ncbi:MAG TPA: hypothetical protein ENH41_00535 [Candidatus Omnitrophica bacterium]|nr:hypothetical protein [Candidatus Omnitrophota bacterium]